MLDENDEARLSQSYSGCGMLLSCLFGSSLCGIAACFGAGLTGLSAGHQGLGVALWFFFGVMGGGLLTLGLSVFAISRLKNSSKPKNTTVYTYPLVYAPLIVFLLGVVSVPLLKSIHGMQSESRQKHSKASEKRQILLHETLIKDPELAIRENWVRGDYDQSMVFERSFRDNQVAYSLEQLQRIHVQNPELVDIFMHPGWDPASLERVFQKAYDLALLGRSSMLDRMIRNPQMPRRLIERVAEVGDFSLGHVTYDARNILLRPVTSEKPKSSGILTVPAEGSRDKRIVSFYIEQLSNDGYGHWVKGSGKLDGASPRWVFEHASAAELARTGAPAMEPLIQALKKSVAKAGGKWRSEQMMEQKRILHALECVARDPKLWDNMHIKLPIWGPKKHLRSGAHQELYKGWAKYWRVNKSEIRKVVLRSQVRKG